MTPLFTLKVEFCDSGVLLLYVDCKGGFFSRKSNFTPCMDMPITSR